MAQEKFPSSETGGVKPMPIEGPWGDERMRLTGMTDEDRAYRKQWLKDQILSETEPVEIPGYYEARFNPIRRFYRWPLDTVFKQLVPVMGYETAAKYRWYTGRIGLMLIGVYATFYYFKYNRNNWERKGGWRVYSSISDVVPGDPGFPMVSQKTEGADYDSRNFKSSRI